MIFSIEDHIQQIIDGTKTQTRRPSDRYETGRTYAIQPKRGKNGIQDGRIKIICKWPETYLRPISIIDAASEGGYTPEQYEELYEKMYPDWIRRWGYEFEFVPSHSLSRKVKT